MPLNHLGSIEFAENLKHLLDGAQDAVDHPADAALRVANMMQWTYQVLTGNQECAQ